MNLSEYYFQNFMAHYRGVTNQSLGITVTVTQLPVKGNKMQTISHMSPYLDVYF